MVNSWLVSDTPTQTSLSSSSGATSGGVFLTVPPTADQIQQYRFPASTSYISRTPLSIIFLLLLTNAYQRKSSRTHVEPNSVISGDIQTYLKSSCVNSPYPEHKNPTDLSHWLSMWTYAVRPASTEEFLTLLSQTMTILCKSQPPLSETQVKSLSSVYSFDIVHRITQVYLQQFLEVFQIMVKFCHEDNIPPLQYTGQRPTGPGVNPVSVIEVLEKSTFVQAYLVNIISMRVDETTRSLLQKKSSSLSLFNVVEAILSVLDHDQKVAQAAKVLGNTQLYTLSESYLRANTPSSSAANSRLPA